MNVAWDGSQATFWASLHAVASGTDDEGDAALFCDVVEMAQRARLAERRCDQLEARMSALHDLIVRSC